MTFDPSTFPPGTRAAMAVLTTKEYEAMLEKVQNKTGFGINYEMVVHTEPDGTKWFIPSMPRNSWVNFRTHADALNALNIWSVNKYAPVEGIVRVYLMEGLEVKINPEWLNSEALIVTVVKFIPPDKPSPPPRGIWMNERNFSPLTQP